LHSPPLLIEVVAVAPDGPPIGFRYQRRQQRVVRHWGPERIESAWWRGPSVRRDYYRVETDDGQRYWLFRELKCGQWFLHGDFG
jgi:protein ImuB